MSGYKRKKHVAYVSNQGLPMRDEEAAKWLVPWSAASTQASYLVDPVTGEKAWYIDVFVGKGGDERYVGSWDADTLRDQRENIRQRVQNAWMEIPPARQREYQEATPAQKWYLEDLDAMEQGSEWEWGYKFQNFDWDSPQAKKYPKWMGGTDGFSVQEQMINAKKPQPRIVLPSKEEKEQAKALKAIKAERDFQRIKKERKMTVDPMFVQAHIQEAEQRIIEQQLKKQQEYLEALAKVKKAAQEELALQEESDLLAREIEKKKEAIAAHIAWEKEMQEAQAKQEAEFRRAQREVEKKFEQDDMARKEAARIKFQEHQVRKMIEQQPGNATGIQKEEQKLLNMREQAIAKKKALSEKREWIRLELEERQQHELEQATESLLQRHDTKASDLEKQIRIETKTLDNHANVATVPALMIAGESNVARTSTVPESVVVDGQVVVIPPDHDSENARLQREAREELEERQRNREETNRLRMQLDKEMAQKRKGLDELRISKAKNDELHQNPVGSARGKARPRIEPPSRALPPLPQIVINSSGLGEAPRSQRVRIGGVDMDSATVLALDQMGALSQLPESQPDELGAVEARQTPVVTEHTHQTLETVNRLAREQAEENRDFDFNVAFNVGNDGEIELEGNTRKIPIKGKRWWQQKIRIPEWEFWEMAFKH